MHRGVFAAIAVAVLIGGPTPGVAIAADGQAVFAASCATCHFSHADLSRHDDMVAPPIDMATKHVLRITGDDRAAFVARVVDYVSSPAVEKSSAPMAIQHFGLMPAIGETFPDLTGDELQAVAGWLYDTYAHAPLPRGMDRMGKPRALRGDGGNTQ